jgi:hypothetical protein
MSKLSPLAAEWNLVAGFILAAAIALISTHTSLALGRFWWPCLSIIPLLGAAAFTYRYLRPVPVLADLTSTTLKLFLILVLGMLISFAAAALGGKFPYRDMWLESADAALGFDWTAYVDFISERPFLARLLDLAYQSLQAQFFVVGAALAIAGQRQRLQIYTLAVGITLAVTLMIFLFMQARSHSWGNWVPPLDYMRLAGQHRISLDDLNGIVTFPSYHTESACLFIWGCWRLAYLRWPVIAFNLTLIAATPIDGFHYGVDVLAGVAIAVATIVLLSPKGTASAVKLAPVDVG